MNGERGFGGEGLRLAPVRWLHEVELGRCYLVRICGEWFVGGFAVEDSRFFHSARGRGPMWDGYTLGMLVARGLLERLYPLPECEPVRAAQADE